MEPSECASRWHQWSVKGTGEILTRVLEHLDAALPGEWRRLRGEELRAYQSLVRPGSAWYSLATTPSYTGVTVSVERLLDAELRGGRVWLAGPPYPAATVNIPAAWHQVMRLLDEGIVPAAQSARASIWVPTSDDLFLASFPADIAERLRKFSRASRKSLPLNPKEAEQWQTFVIGAFRMKTAVEPRSFVDWLVHEGWDSAMATELSLRFLDEYQLLTRYAEEVPVA